MPNTHRGWAIVPLFAGSGLRFDNIASMIAAGSAVGGAYEGGASVLFPRVASLNQVAGSVQYHWDALIFRSSATSMFWSTDPLGTANASIGLPMFGSDPKPLAYPVSPANFNAYAVGAGLLAMIFLEGDDLSL